MAAPEAHNAPEQDPQDQPLGPARREAIGLALDESASDVDRVQGALVAVELSLHQGAPDDVKVAVWALLVEAGECCGIDFTTGQPDEQPDVPDLMRRTTNLLQRQQRHGNTLVRRGFARRLLLHRAP